MVDASGLHGLSCRKSAPRQQRHAMINDVIWRVIKRAQVPAHKVPVGLVTQGGKRPDGATLIPWAKGKPLAWDVTVPDTFADSHINSTSTEAGSAAKQAATFKDFKYADIASTHLFFPIAIETAGTYDARARVLIDEIYRRITDVTEESKDTIYLYQRISIIIQRGSPSDSFTPSTMTTRQTPLQSFNFPLF